MGFVVFSVALRISRAVMIVSCFSQSAMMNPISFCTDSVDSNIKKKKELME